MTLNDVKLNTNCVVKSVNIEDYKSKMRIMELGLIEGAKVVVKNKSALKKTLLIAFNYGCFTLKNNIAEKVVVEYV